MDFRIIQDAERQMLRDGKSAAAIDAMKSAYRKQMFNPDGYSQTAGLGSFASGGEAYGPPPVSGPVPQGIASFQEGGKAESFFSRFNPLTGSYRKKKPLSVRAAETAIDFTPVAAVKTGQEIYDESQSEDPSLLKMGIMAAGEAAGLIPFAGPAVKTMVRRVPADLADEIAGLNRRSVDTEINNYRLNLERNTDLSPDEIDVRVENYAANQEGAVSGAVRELTDTEKLADEIAADLRAGNTDLVTDDRLDELDFLGEIRLRQHYIEGNVGVDADGVPITLENAEREARMLAQGYERVGVHGTMPTQEGVSVDDLRVIRPSSYGKSGRGVYLDVEPTGMNFGDGEIVNPSGIPYPTANRFAGYNPDPRSIDRGKGAAGRIPEGSQMYPLVQRGPLAKSTDYTAARRELIKQNPDLDTVELDRLANQRLMDQGFTGIDSRHYGEITSFEGGNLRAPTAIFDPRLTNLKNIGMADGGAVMRGIGTLNETARNMTRGPRGIGAYQQFADGGVVPRQTMINNQPHMLAYINPEEEQMLLENGGAGLPGPGGVPAYWKLFEPSTWKGGSNYTPGAGFEGFTSSSSSAPETSLRPQARPISIYNPSDNGNNGGGAEPVVTPKPEPEPQGIMGLYDKVKDFFNPNSQAIAAMRGSGIKGNPDDPRNQGLTMFPGPISMGLKGLAYLGGLRKTDPIVKVTDDKNVYQSGAGGFYIINSVTGLPMMVESPEDLSLSSDARERMDAMMTDMNKSDNDNGPGSCGPGYVYDYSAGACVPMIGTTATSEDDALGTPQTGGSIVVPDPVYLPVGLAEGGEVEEPLSEYQRALIASESSGRSNVVNDRGYRGLTQAGDAALADFKDQEGLNFSDEQYLNSPELQMQFQRWYEQKTINYVMDKGLDAYIGKVIKGVPITMSSLLGMAHIGGDFGMQQFLETGGRYDPNDGKTSLSDYGRKFANMAIYGESGGENFNRVTPEDALMSMPVEQEGSLAFYRPRARPPEIEFSAPATSLRPIARPEEMMEPELEEIDASMQPRRQELREKYSLASMAEALTQQEPVGIMSATR